MKILVCMFSVLVLFAGFAWWWLFTIPISKTTLQRLTPGMTQAQVYGVLGAANQTNVLGNGETWWIYSRKPSVAYLLVRFDYSGFKEYVID